MSAGYDESHIAGFDFHHSMLTDAVRTESFLKAIMASVHPGDIVVDIGTGTGVLALFAARAGAAKVYAIERDPVLDLAREVVAANGYSERIEFVAGVSTDVELPERGDVLITETIGNAAFDEGILAWTSDAMGRLVKDTAVVVPGRLDLVATALELPRDAADIDRLRRPLHTLDFSALRKVVINNLIWDELSPVSVVAEPMTVCSVDLAAPPSSAGGIVETTARRDATVHAIGLWFDAEIAPGVPLTNAPPSAAPSWHQGVLMLDEPFEVTAGTHLSLEVLVNADGTEWSWRVVGHGNTQSTTKGILTRN